jgi:hypothetical protein
MPSQVSPGASHRRFGVSHVNGVLITGGLPKLRIFVTNFRKFFRAGLLGEQGWVGEGSTRSSREEPPSVPLAIGIQAAAARNLDFLSCCCLKAVFC